MTWYAAHIVYATQRTDRKNGPFLVEEQVYIVEGKSRDEALQQANVLAHNNLLVDETLTLDGKPATIFFAGIRKLVSVACPDGIQQDAPAPIAKAEVTYSFFKVKNRNSLKKFIDGQAVQVTYLGT